MDHDDWEKLDDLLNKEGYGGYYDLLELLKMYIRAWYEDKFGMDGIQELERNIQNIKTLHQATNMLSGIHVGDGKNKEKIEDEISN